MPRLHAALLTLTIVVASCGEPPPEAGPPIPYREVETTDVSFGTVKRYSTRIILPPGHSREEVTATLEAAARRIQERTDADAVNVFAYRSQDNVRGAYTIGRTIYAPNGSWVEAGSRSPKRFVTDLNDLYFDPPKPMRAAGDTVVLRDSLFDYVTISDSYDEWGDEHVVERAKNGSRAVVLEVRADALGAFELVRYRIQLLGQPDAAGWVFEGSTGPAR